MDKYTPELLSNPFYRDRTIGDHLFVSTEKMKAEAINLGKFLEALYKKKVDEILSFEEFDYFEIIFIIGAGTNIQHQIPIDIIYLDKPCYEGKRVCKLLLNIDITEASRHNYRCCDFEPISTKKTEFGKKTIEILEPEYFMEYGNTLLITKQFNTFMPNICDKDLPHFREKLQKYSATTEDVKFVSEFITIYRNLVEKLFENKTKCQINIVNYAVFLNIYSNERMSRYITYPLIPLNFGVGYEMFDYLLIGLKDRYRSDFYKIYTWAKPKEMLHELFLIANKSSLVKI
jgi:hypothetical protein